SYPLDRHPRRPRVERFQLPVRVQFPRHPSDARRPFVNDSTVLVRDEILVRSVAADRYGAVVEGLGGHGLGQNGTSSSSITGVVSALRAPPFESTCVTATFWYFLPESVTFVHLSNFTS